MTEDKTVLTADQVDAEPPTSRGGPVKERLFIEIYYG